MKDIQNIKVRFHVGRGGQFHNAGHKTYVGTLNDLFNYFCESFIISEDENGKILPDSEWRMMDGGGNVVLSGRDEIESETGIIYFDGKYDSDIVRYLEDCEDVEYQMILDADERGGHVEEPVLAYACHELGKLMATNIKVYPCNMEVFTQEGFTTLMRDNFAAYSEDEEDEVRIRLEEQGFISQSIDEIIDNMKIYHWFSVEEEEK